MVTIKPYTAVGLIPTVRGIRNRADIRINLDHLMHLIKAATWLSSLDLPVRLIAIPGDETDLLGALAREYDTYIIAPAKARHPDWNDRFFNVGFLIDPMAKVIL